MLKLNELNKNKHHLNTDTVSLIIYGKLDYSK